MKVLITGGGGLLGQYLNETLDNNHDILTIYNKNIGNCKYYNSHNIDITDYSSLRELFIGFNPDIVIHTAAISNPQKADQLPSKVVYKVNVKTTENIARLCDLYNCKMIYTSTDLVYDGDRSSNLTENSKLNPLSLYAETKLLGEEKIRGTFENYLILRVALLYGFGLDHSRNHFTEVYKNLKNNKSVNLFCDQFRSPLALHDAARMINDLILLEVNEETLNFGGTKRISRFELIEMFCRLTGFDKFLLNKISMDDIEFPYKVRDVSMSVNKLKSYGIKPMRVEESIKEILKKSYDLL